MNVRLSLGQGIKIESEERETSVSDVRAIRLKTTHRQQYDADDNYDDNHQTSSSLPGFPLIIRGSIKLLCSARCVICDGIDIRFDVV